MDGLYSLFQVHGEHLLLQLGNKTVLGPLDCECTWCDIYSFRGEHYKLVAIPRLTLQILFLRSSSKALSRTYPNELKQKAKVVQAAINPLKKKLVRRRTSQYSVLVRIGVSGHANFDKATLTAAL